MPSPEVQVRWRYVRAVAQGAAECAAQFGFGFLLGTAVVTAVYSIPVGAERAVAWVISILGSVVALFFMNWAVNVVRGRRPMRRHRHPSTDSQAHNLSIHALIRGFRRG